jgi:hypothetical protein
MRRHTLPTHTHTHTHKVVCAHANDDTHCCLFLLRSCKTTIQKLHPSTAHVLLIENPHTYFHATSYNARAFTGHLLNNTPAAARVPDSALAHEVSSSRQWVQFSSITISMQRYIERANAHHQCIGHEHAAAACVSVASVHVGHGSGSCDCQGASQQRCSTFFDKQRCRCHGGHVSSVSGHFKLRSRARVYMHHPRWPRIRRPQTGSFWQKFGRKQAA